MLKNVNHELRTSINKHIDTIKTNISQTIDGILRSIGNVNILINDIITVIPASIANIFENDINNCCCFHVIISDAKVFGKMSNPVRPYCRHLEQANFIFVKKSNV